MVPDQGTLTQLMIILRLYEGEDKPSSIARDVGITLQGVQYNIKQLEKRGFVDGNSRVTKEGFNFIDAYLSELRDFVSKNLSKLDNVKTWEAIADSNFALDDPVSLYLKDGYLHASFDTLHPTGRAAWTAKTGDVVGVKDVKDMIDVKVGNVSIVVLPSPSSSENYGAMGEKLSGIIRDDAILAVSGEFAYAAAQRLGLKHRIEFASIEGSFEAASRGLNVFLIISGRRFHFSLNSIKEMESKYPEIGIQIKYL